MFGRGLFIALKRCIRLMYTVECRMVDWDSRERPPLKILERNDE
jgi:hypothetical protein